MSSLKALSIFSFLFAALHFPSVHAATFDITNKCPYTVWAAAVPGGGRQLNNGETWTISAAPGTTQARIWARQGYGSPPNTLAEYALRQYANLDYIDISNSCTRVIKCTADIVGQCPNELKVPGGCNGPCPVFKTDEYWYFKERCPDAYSYPKDDPTSLFTCPTGTNYKVIFCP
ncbi:hypothetical protein NC651_001146 [Populus alba x Populus x berolinensis]|nr:hypothetical protein NC651_001146 [Populus alba x Populus x berolinensis]